MSSRTKRKEILLTPEEFAQFQKLANEAGLKLSAWMVFAIKEHVKAQNLWKQNFSKLDGVESIEDKLMQIIKTLEK